jgi:hypothetical protein
MNEYDSYHDINDERLYQILTNMMNDNNYCFHCIEYHVGAETLQSFIEKKSICRKRNENLKVTRTIFNVLSIVTAFVTFIVFGGSKLIYFISFCSSSLIFASIYVESVSHVVIFETSAVLLSLIVFLKCLYVIHFAIIVIEKLKNR